MGKGKGMGISAELRYEEMGNKNMGSGEYRRQLVGNKGEEVCKTNIRTPLN